MALGGWTIGTEPQCIVLFAKGVKRPTEEPLAADDFYCLQGIFTEEEPDCASASDQTTSRGDRPQNHAPEVDACMENVLVDFRPMFTTTPGCTILAQHPIDTRKSPSVRCKLRPVNAKKQKIIDGCVQDLLEQGLIRQSNRQWTSAPALVANKSGGFRLAIDYWPLNACTREPVYPMPRTDWLLA
ncbi:uncharacterized protein LOC120837010 [Ixodes scapularis]|uniref:uncharacterized protein LOC120837010 n=1 Tax=Ixodes scapularis TaxID=6945 RepID=UPI001A9FB902|nr:uncharacterized protein LOC120837010 [Ixodes scapularis]